MLIFFDPMGILVDFRCREIIIIMKIRKMRFRHIESDFSLELPGWFMKAISSLKCGFTEIWCVISVSESFMNVIFSKSKNVPGEIDL